MSVRRPSGRGFTLIELLVVVAIIALLISILLPSLKRAKDQAKKAVCLAHLREIGTAGQEYASEDDRNLLMPLSPVMVRPMSQWMRKTAMWFTWGGACASQEFLTPGGPFMLDETSNKPYFGAQRRPMTKYIYPEIANDSEDAPVFECPADRGYPDFEDVDISDSPRTNAERRCYDTLGNSYRGSLACLVRGWNNTWDAFSRGVWGQRLDRLEDTGRQLFLGEPLFYFMIGSDTGGWEQAKIYGWHNEFQAENELYADGSARMTTAVASDDPRWLPSDADLGDWGITNPAYKAYLSRGPDYKLDCHPTPGVKFGNFPAGGSDSWPFFRHTVTPPPIDRP
jgi:prepilin-type N-terminal cleavage/methylation domain-containing protein